mmetsp:Transcript_27464/g.61377  ORF Transcript_27464/g.61377 Transcript_27464/m.61377 type:complete len:83 (-) Transcript_27464:34-282(-)
MRGGVLDEELAEEEWIRFVAGDDYYADERALASFRTAINDHIARDEDDDLQRNSEGELLDENPAARPSAASPPAAALPATNP